MHNVDAILGEADAFGRRRDIGVRESDLDAVLRRLMPLLDGFIVSTTELGLRAQPRQAAGLVVMLDCGPTGYSLHFNGVALDADRLEDAVDLCQRGLRGTLRVAVVHSGGKVISEHLERLDAGGRWLPIAGYARFSWRARAARRTSYHFNSPHPGVSPPG